MLDNNNYNKNLRQYLRQGNSSGFTRPNLINKKAVLFTLDALFASIIAAIVILASFQYLSQTHIARFNRQDIYRLSVDSLGVLERNSALSNAVTGNTSNIEAYLGSLPAQVCANVTLFTLSSFQIGSVEKASCANTNKDNLVATYRVFVAPNSTAYYARMDAWYR